MRNIITNTSWLLLEKIVSMGGNLFVTVVIARSLGVEEFGTFNYLLALIAILTPISTIGINAILSRDVLNRPENEIVIFSSGISLRFLGGVIFSFSLLAVGYYFLSLNNQEFTYLTILVALNITNCFQGLEFWFQAKLKMRALSIFRLLLVLIFLVLKITFASSNDAFFALILIFGAEAFVRGLGCYFLFAKACGNLSFNYIDKLYSKELVKNSFWLFLSGIAAVIYLKIDQVMLAEISGHAETGVYSVAVRLSEVWYFFATAFVSSIFPLIMNAKKSNENVYYQKLQYCSDMLCWSAALIAIVVSCMSDFFIELVFGTEYSKSAPILVIHIWGAIFVFMRALISKWILAENLLKISLYSQGLGAVCNVILNYLLIPEFGGIGAAISTVVSYIFSGWLIFYCAENTRPVAKMVHNSLLLPLFGAKRYKPILRKIRCKM